MTTTSTATVGRTDGPDRAPAELLDVKAVAHLLTCSTRHIYRLADGGKMPRPVKLRGLVRWSRSAVLEWIAAGCPNCRKGARRG